MEHSRVSRDKSWRRAGNGRTQVRASRTVPRARSRGPAWADNAILGRAAEERSEGPGGRTGCALLTRFAFGDDTIGSQGFIAAKRACERTSGRAGMIRS
jgi:hypothetical protein